MAKKKDSLILYYGLYEDLQNLTKTEIADVILAAFNYEINGVLPELKSRSARIVFRNIAKSLDINKEKYEETCKKNRDNINKRWESEKTAVGEEYDRIRSYTTVSNGSSFNTKNTDTVYVNENNTVKDTYKEYVNDEVCLSEDESSAIHTHKKQYGIFSNISLDDGQYEQIRQLFPNDYQQRIDSMSSYMKAQGKTYKDDFARLCSWKLLDRKEEKPKKDNSPSYDIDAYMQQAINLEYKKIN